MVEVSEFIYNIIDESEKKIEFSEYKESNKLIINLKHIANILLLVKFPMARLNRNKIT